MIRTLTIACRIPTLPRRIEQVRGDERNAHEILRGVMRRSGTIWADDWEPLCDMSFAAILTDLGVDSTRGNGPGWIVLSDTLHSPAPKGPRA